MAPFVSAPTPRPLDVDDTTLATWNDEIFSNWASNPATNATYVLGPAPTTLSNGEDGLFPKPAVADYPDYPKTACADEIGAGKTCTTVRDKTATRAHIESLGYEIVGNFGDQFSDLEGGHG